MSDTVWGDDIGVTWANATDAQRESFAWMRLYWFFRMVETGVDDAIRKVAEEVAEEEAARWATDIAQEAIEQRARAEAAEAARDIAIAAVRKYHEWLERIEELRVCPGCGRRGYMGLDHAVGENTEGCEGCAALDREAGE